MYLAGAGLAGTIADCSITDTSSIPVSGYIALEKLYIDTATTNRVTLRNTTIQGGPVCGGIFKLGTGLLTLTNCLIASAGGHGIQVTAGTTTLAQCTMANNVGWGVSNAPALVIVTNSVLWGNTAGGVISTNGKFSYTCSQELLAGTGNMNVNPLFAIGYYLSVNGLPTQGADSPCIDAGSMTAAAAGLDERTTRTDGTGDAGQVDLGYHPSAGLSSSISNLNLYVNVATGSDANDGWTAGSPLKTITAALLKTLDGSTLYVATGRYYRASGEVFPLTSLTPNLSVIGANRATTILDATLTNRVFSADGRGNVRFEGLTLANGRESQGGCLSLLKCLSATITNCLFLNNRIPNTSPTNSWGGGIYAINGRLAVSDSEFRGNGWSQYSSSWGGGLYALNADVTIQNSLFATNYLGVNSGAYGAGVYLSGGSALIAGCTFNTNFVDRGYNHQGGALYASVVSPLTISNCTFAGNNMASFNGVAQGGALYISGCKPLTVARCTFIGNKVVAVNAAREAGTMLLTGAALGGIITDCDVTGESSGITPETLSIDTTGTNGITIQNTVIRGVTGSGINKKGTGSLVLTNCLVYSFASHGVVAGTGTVTVANSTLADNGGWGVTNTLGSVNVANSVIRGNLAGGVSSTNGSVTYTCSQETLAGVGNMNSDPLFVAGYYLSAAGLPSQGSDSPCINAGSATAAALGLDTRTTRTDGNADAGVVDLGYHPATGFMESFDNLVLYVNVATGSDANDGWTAGSPLKTITAALGKTISGSTVYVATGRYYQASGEIFPLVSRQPNLTVIGADRAATVLDATGTNRVFTGEGRGQIWLEGLTLANGNLTDAWRFGGGLYLPGCRTTITNCVIVSNRIDLTGSSYGQGIAAVEGALTVVDSVVKANGKLSSSSADDFGGGIYAANAAVELRRVTLSANILKVNANAQGAGVYLSGGRGFVDECSFTTNIMDVGYGHRGGGLYASGVNPFTIRNSAFIGNYGWAGNGVANGGALWVGTSPVMVSNCTFNGNYVGAGNSTSRGGAIKFQNCNGFSIAACMFTNNTVRFIAGNACMEGGAIYLTGTPLAGSIAGCTIYGQTNASTAPDNVSIAPGISNTVTIVNTAMMGGRGSGVLKNGLGGLALTNCLIHSFTNHGVVIGTGSVVLVNVTLANNRGWGLLNTTNAVTVRNSIAWGNTNGGFSGSGNAISYTCSQEAQAGTDNQNQNPLFINATSNFRLLKGSPCLNTGLNEDWMASAKDLDGNPRIRSMVVDRGAFEADYPRGSIIYIR